MDYNGFQNMVTQHNLGFGECGSLRPLLNSYVFLDRPFVMPRARRDRRN